MKKLTWIIVLLLLVCSPVHAVSAASLQSDDSSTPLLADTPTDGVKDMAFSMEDASDPIEPLNRAMFGVNDLLYFSAIRPISMLYEKIMPEPIRIGGRNFFHNLAMPQHFLSALLQGDVQKAGIEVGRFCVNTLLGGLGLVDVAERFGLKSADEDIGQALGSYGAGDSLYVVWPLLGPSNLRDSVGLVGDVALNPITYLTGGIGTQAGILAYKTVNDTSLHLGEYEDFKKAAFDPYISLRNAYLQKRATQIQD